MASLDSVVIGAVAEAGVTVGMPILNTLGGLAALPTARCFLGLCGTTTKFKPPSNHSFITALPH